MDDPEVIVYSVVVVGLLVGYLYERRWRLKCRQLRERHWAGQGIEVGEVTPRLQAVRRDYAGEAHQHAKPVERHGELVTAARQMVATLSYFKHREPVPATQANADEVTEAKPE